VTLRASLGTGARAVRDALEGAAATGLAGRVRAGDASAFGPHSDAARDWLGWLRAPIQGRGHVADIETLLRELRTEGVRHVVVLGMGGSSLSPEVTRRTFGHRAGIELRVLDSTDPAAVSAAGAGVDPERALYLVSSKSGTTVETLAFLAHFWAQAEGALGAGGAGSRFLAITDPGTPLVAEAADRGFRAVAESPADVGGRYSALSLFGLVPMGLAGVPLQPLLDRAQVALASDDGPRLGIALAALAEAGRDKVTLVCDPPIAGFGLWVEQLLAESLGKEGRGLVPVEGEPLDGVEAYGEDRLFVYHRMTGEHDADLADAAAEGHPVLTLDVPEPLELGGLYLTWQLATACAGALLGVNPFDQPDVQAAKAATDAALAQILAGEGPDETLGPPEALAGWVDAAAPGDYLALQAFLPPSPAADRALAAIRTAARARNGVATTAGYGPRYLHSTGQLHKGGPPTGRLVQLVAEHEADLGVPGRPFTFGQLERAQALGDARVLAERGRAPLRIGLGADARSGLAAALRSLA
jgi:transaldolase / glucose-6-phosphate isomerase